jgi:hypothetical protein
MPKYALRHGATLRAWDGSDQAPHHGEIGRASVAGRPVAAVGAPFTAALLLDDTQCKTHSANHASVVTARGRGRSRLLREA